MLLSRVFHRNTFRIAGMAVAACCACLAPGKAQSQAVWEWTPYQFQIYLAAEASPELTPRVLDDLAVDLVDRIETIVGAAWDVTVAPAESGLRRAMLADLAAVDDESIPAEALKRDKVTLVLIVPETTGYRVAARELDVWTRTFSAAAEKHAASPALLCGTMLAAIRDSFAALASIELVEDGSVALRLRAGRLPPRDPSFLTVGPGNVFRPIIRYDERDGSPKRIISLPWTFLTVEGVDHSELTCQLHSGLRSALAGRRRGRVHQLALSVRPSAEPTRLIVRARTGSKQPLSGYDVFTQQPGETSAEWLGRTDLAGSILVPPAPHLLQILYVRNGGQLLARLPLVPGLEDEVAADVVDDAPRLAAEGAVMSAQEELVDLVTKRAVLSARIRAAIGAGDLGSAERMLIELHGLRTRDQFTGQLNQQRQRLYSEDPIIRRRIDAMFEETRKLVVQYLNPNDIDKLAEEVRNAKAAAAAAQLGA